MKVNIDDVDVKDRPIIKTVIDESEKLTLANKSLVGLMVIYLSAVVFFAFKHTESGKLVFISTQQLVTSVGSFIYGYYFSRKN